MTKARGAPAALGIRYGGVLCKDTAAVAASKRILLIDQLSVVDNASAIAAMVELIARAVEQGSHVGRGTRSERADVYKLTTHFPAPSGG